MEHFLDLSLPVPEVKPTRSKRLCGTDADEKEGGEYVLASSKSRGSNRSAKYALKEEGKAAHREKKHRQQNAAAAAAATDRTTDDKLRSESEKRQTNSDSGQELDRHPDAASAGESDTDEEDNISLDLVIDALPFDIDQAEDREEPPTAVSPSPPTDKPLSADVACQPATLVPRYQATTGECSLLTCLDQYTAPELLTDNNKFGCDSCTEQRNKQLPPAEKDETRSTVYTVQ